METSGKSSSSERVQARLEYLQQLFNINEYILIKSSDLQSDGSSVVQNLTEAGSGKLRDLLTGIEALHLAQLDAMEEQNSNQKRLLRRGQQKIENLEQTIADLRHMIEEKDQILSSFTIGQLVEASDALAPEEAPDTDEPTSDLAAVSTASVSEPTADMPKVTEKSVFQSSGPESNLTERQDEDMIDIFEDTVQTRNPRISFPPKTTIIDAKKLLQTMKAASRADPSPDAAESESNAAEPQEDMVDAHGDDQTELDAGLSRTSKTGGATQPDPPPTATRPNIQPPTIQKNQNASPIPPGYPNSKHSRMSSQLKKMCENPILRDILISPTSGKITLLAWTSGTPQKAVTFQTGRVSNIVYMQSHIFVPIFQLDPSTDESPPPLSLVGVLTPRVVLTKKQIEEEILEDVSLPQYLDQGVWCVWNGHPLLRKRHNKFLLNKTPFLSTAPILMEPSCSRWDILCDFVPRRKQRPYLEFTEVVTNFGSRRAQGPKRFLFKIQHSTLGKDTELCVPYWQLHSMDKDATDAPAVLLSFKAVLNLSKMASLGDFENSYLRKSKLDEKKKTKAKGEEQRTKKRPRTPNKEDDSTKGSPKPLKGDKATSQKDSAATSPGPPKKRRLS